MKEKVMNNSVLYHTNVIFMLFISFYLFIIYVFLLIKGVTNSDLTKYWIFGSRIRGLQVLGWQNKDNYF